ncbi:MAG TPA: hypothetical protein VHU41_13735, partial [Thermoanaerobaculia bacterium]|nr:hypothetical protein [Thermoanaerobaculia bacterium]
MSRLLVAPAVFVILSACAAQHAACPRDTTADFDVSIEQTNRPVAARPSISTATLEKRSPYGTPSDTAYANVRYTITIVNRLNEPLHIREITLDAAHVTGVAMDQCFGFK